jgi:hypothetical protein
MKQPVRPFEIKAQDILLGKGGPNAVHVGTIAFKAIIESRVEEYMNATQVTVNGKSLVTLQIVESVHLTGGRFLCRDETQAINSNQDWCTMSKMAARVKVREFFREFIKNVRKQRRPCVLLHKMGLSGLFGKDSSYSEILLHVASSKGIRDFVITRNRLIVKRTKNSSALWSSSEEKKDSNGISCSPGGHLTNRNTSSARNLSEESSMLSSTSSVLGAGSLPTPTPTTSSQQQHTPEANSCTRSSNVSIATTHHYYGKEASELEVLSPRTLPTTSSLTAGTSTGAPAALHPLFPAIGTRLRTVLNDEYSSTTRGAPKDSSVQVMASDAARDPDKSMLSKTVQQKHHENGPLLHTLPHVTLPAPLFDNRRHQGELDMHQWKNSENSRLEQGAIFLENALLVGVSSRNIASDDNMTSPTTTDESLISFSDFLFNKNHILWKEDNNEEDGSLSLEEERDEGMEYEEDGDQSSNNLHLFSGCLQQQQESGSCSTRKEDRLFGDDEDELLSSVLL